MFYSLCTCTLASTQGHEAGDQLLIEVASRIQSAVGMADCVIGPEDEGVNNVVARFGGNEFVVMLTTKETPEHANDIALKIVTSIAAPYIISGDKCVVGACVSLAISPEDAGNINGILANADAAINEAKRAGINTWRRYVPGLSRILQKRNA